MLTISHPNSPESYYAKDGLEAEGGFRLPVDGKLADSLCLSGIIPREQMIQLFRNRTPDGQKLTQRDRFDRRKCTDYCFSPPKSVSLMHQFAGDTRIPEAVSEAASATMREVADGLVVRRKGKREAADVLWLPEYHLLARPVKGKSDPQDHLHFVVPNAGLAPDGKRYAIDNAEVARDAPYYRFRFQHELATRLHGLGYDLRQTKHGFEIAGVPDAMIRTFSRRGEKVEATAEAKDIKAPKAKAALAALTREKKKPYDAEEARQEWLSRLSPRQAAGLDDLYGKALQRAGRSLGGQESPLPSVLPAMLERDSEVREKELLEQCWRVNPLWEPSFPALLRKESKGERYFTTLTNWERKQEMVDNAKANGMRLIRTRNARPPKGALVVPAAEIHTKVVEFDTAKPLHITDADKLTFHEVCRLAASDRKIVLYAPPRDYRKPQDGNPLVALEDIGGLNTGQSVMPKMVGRVTKKTRELIRRMRYLMQPEREASYELTRSAQREMAYER